MKNEDTFSTNSPINLNEFEYNHLILLLKRCPQKQLLEAPGQSEGFPEGRGRGTD